MSNDYSGKKRSELPDSVFGIPQERKYPMPDEKHTRSAIKLFNHVDPKYEEQLAKAVIKNMKKYGIDGSVVGPNNRLRKYLPEDMIKESMDSLLYEYMYTDNDPDIIIQESGYALTWRIMPILLKAALSGVDQYDYKYLREKKLPAILKKCKTMDDIKYMRRDAITAKTQMEILKRNVHAVNTNDENIMKRLNKSFVKKVKDGKITEKEIDIHIRWLNTEYKKLIDARAKEIKDSIKESYIEEGFLKSDKDIYYNKDKFDSGEINLCFITGLIGSGKTTMSKEISSKNIECYEIDDVIFNYCLSDNDLKDKKLLYLFFNGIGKKYRYRYKDNEYNHNLYYSFENYEKDITIDFVKYSIEYASSYTNKIVIDGIWIYLYIEPKLLSDYAVYIKGTSMVKSSYRATNRGIQNKIDKGTDLTPADIAKKYIFRIKKDLKFGKMHMQKLKSFRSYFEKQLTNESVSSTVSKDHKQKGYISLSSLKKVHITESVINKYKKEYPVLRHVRCKDTNEYICDGYMWFKENDLVCYVGSCQYTDDHTKWIVSLEIIPKYRGYGLSTQILDFCVKSMKCKYLSVNKNNELAKKIYDKYGFKVYHEDKTMYYMTLDSIIKESSSRKITTVVFDLGDVLIKSNMQEKLRKNPKIPNQQIYPLLEKWFDDDLDLLSKEEYIDTISKRLAPDFSDIVPDIVDAFSDIEVLSYTIPTLKDLKERGYNIYYLSNWSRWGVEILRENNKLDFLSLFDGGLFSYEVGVKKPDRKIYDAFLKKFKINPKEAIFVDNKKKNIDAAEKFGIKGVLFSNEKDLQKYIKNMQSNVNESSPILPQDTGISTVIFDIGDVLVSANIKDYLVADPEVPDEIVDELLKLWFIEKDEVDDTMDLDTYREIVNKRMGVEFSKYIPKLFQYNVDCVTAFDYTIPMIQDLKDKGYKVYYLSNWSAWTHDLLQEAGKFDFLEFMDGGVFSYDVGYMKPNEEIYKVLLNKYKINPEEAIFFDDREENIEAANKLGIHGIHFPRNDSSIVYNNLYGRKLAKAIYEDMDNIRYDFDHSYNDKVLKDAYLSYMNEISLGVKVDEDKVAKEILNIIRPIIISQDNKSKASKMRLSLKCEIEEVDSGIVIILVLDGTQDKRDTNDARIMLKELASKCKSKLSNLVSKIDIGDGDEGCLYFTMDKGKIKKNRKDLIKESTNEEITKSEINDIKEIISILNDDDFKNFKFTNIAYCDIRYRNSKPIAFITIRTKPVNNYIVGFVSLAVIPKYQNQGIGRSLTEKAIKWFKKNKGIDFLEWHCLPNNAASNKLANDAGFSKYIAKDDGEYNTYTMESVIETNISEYGTTGGTIVGANQPLYFYHMVDSGANLSKGLLSLGYMYHHSKPLFLKNASKYRDRLCNGWDIYPGRDPKSLTAEEIYEGIKKFRNEDNLNSIYFFKYPPYSSLDKRFDRLYKYKKLYRININDTKVKSIIKNINYGWIDSNTGNDPLDRKYYETISPEDYFNNFDPDKGPLFSTLHHISIEVKNGYIPMRLLEEVKVPNTIEDIISMEESSIQEYGTTGGTIVGANQPDSVYIVNYMQNNVFSGYKEPKQAICKKGMNQMYTTKNGKAIPVDIDKFKEEASDVSVFRFKETPILSFDKIIENASVDGDFYMLLTGDFPEDIIGKTIEYDNRFVQEENFLDELDDITCCTESTITGQIDISKYPYMKILTESMEGRCWNYYRDINGVFAMNELTGLRTPSYEDVMDIPRSQIQLIERGTVYLGE